jgi:cytoskeletal protein CcmA (bactofilin family)
MKKAALFLFITIGILAQSCKKDDDAPSKSGLIIINNNVAENNARLILPTGIDILPIVSYGVQTGERMPNNGQSEDLTSNYNLKQLAEIAAPTYQSNTLQATHVDFGGNYAYVSYNTQGSPYLGGIDVVNVSNPASPSIVQSSVLPNIDVSALTVSGNRLYFVGALDVDLFPAVNSPAYVGYVELSNGLMVGDAVLTELGGFVANSVLVNDDKVYVCSGNTNGGVYILDKTSLDVLEHFVVDGAKNIQFNSSSWMVLEGAYTGSSSQMLSRYSKSTSSYINSVTMPLSINPDAKSNFRIVDENAVVANGYSGVGYWDVTSGNLIDRVGLPDSMPDYDSLDIYTNAVSVDNGYVYAANGAAGIMVSRIENGVNPIKVLGKADIEGSANYVAANAGAIYAASGLSGLKILKLEEKSTPPPTVSCDGRPNMQSNGNGTYIVNSNDQQYFKAPGNNGNTQLGGMNVNSNGLYDFCGRMTIKNTLIVDGIYYIRGDLQVNRDVIINSNGRLVVEGSVVINGNLNFNGTIEFATASSFQVKGNINKNSGAVVINPQNNNGPTQIP